MEITLESTKEMMTSVDWKERFIAEYIQLKIRIQKLMNYINSFEYNQIE